LSRKLSTQNGPPLVVLKLHARGETPVFNVDEVCVREGQLMDIEIVLFSRNMKR
jgi:ethanolamine utilization protein EutA (predicted chaperonin)